MAEGPGKEPTTASQTQASPGILSGFRNLVQARSKQGISHSSTKTNNSSPPPLSLADRQDRAAPSSDASQIHHLDQPRDVGALQLGEARWSEGPPELKQQFERLGEENRQIDRIRAAAAISKLLKDYPINAVAAIWSAARDLLDDRDTSGAVESGYALLVACVRYKTLTPQERMFFFESIAIERSSDEFSLNFDVLEELCGHGRYVESLEPVLVPLLVRLLKSRFGIALNARTRDKKLRGSSPQAEGDKLYRVFQLILNITKFNAKIFTDENLSLLLNQVISICRRTSVELDISKSVALMDALVTYSYIPDLVIRDCIEVLCGAYGQVSAVQDQAWNTITNFIKSHLGLRTMELLIEILHSPSPSDAYRITTKRGVLKVLHSLMHAPVEENLRKPSVWDVIPALKECLNFKDSKLIQDVLLVLVDYTANSVVIETLLDVELWKDFAHVVGACSVTVRGSSQISPARVPTGSAASGLSNQTSLPSSREGPSELFSKIIKILSSVSTTVQMDQGKLLFDLLLSVIEDVADESVVNQVLNNWVYEELLDPTKSPDGWATRCQNLHEKIFKDTRRSSQTRMQALNFIINACYAGKAVNAPTWSEILCKVFENIRREKDLSILNILAEQIVELLKVGLDDMTFDTISGYLEDSVCSPSFIQGRGAVAMQHLPDKDAISPYVTPTTIITDALVASFVGAMSLLPFHAAKLFSSLVRLSTASHAPTQAKIRALRVLVRLRCDINLAIFVTADTQSDYLATILGRAERSIPGVPGSPENSQPHEIKSETQTSSSKPKSTSKSASELSRSASGNRRAFTVKRDQTPIPETPSELWSYPGINGLPAAPPQDFFLIYHRIYCFLREEFFMEGEPTTTTIDIALYLESVISILRTGGLADGLDPKSSDPELFDNFVQAWEIYSYLLVHLPSQLQNTSLFVDSKEQIKSLRTLICDQLKQNRFLEPPLNSLIKKTDIAVCLYHILAQLVGYHEHFSRSEQEELIDIFLLGIGTWEKTPEISIHALSICCYELPTSVDKFLDRILHRMSLIISQAHVAVHVLEFLAGLSRLHGLIKNLTDDDFRKVFGICFRYLENARDKRERAAHAETRDSHPSTRKSGGALQESEHRSQSLANTLPQFVYFMAYHVMTFWFQSCKMEDRRRHLNWISKSLVYRNSLGEQVTDDQSQALVDFMQRIAGNNMPDSKAKTDFAKTRDGAIETKTWIYGCRMYTIETATRTGLSHITCRRPSGTTHRIHCAEGSVDLPRHQEGVTLGLDGKSIFNPSIIQVLPEEIMAEFFNEPMPMSTPNPEPPVLITEDQMFQRAVASFDRISSLDGHKIGVIYIREGQTQESTILANDIGSAAFTDFYLGMGTLLPLKGANFNTQGLDREFGADGEVVLCWRDRVSEIVFHVTTLMPTNLEEDPHCVNKKRHTGNDFVNVIWNDSCEPFNFQTFPSDFNYVNIVITPEAHPGFIDTRINQSANPLAGRYVVQVMTKPGVPQVSPCSHPKLVHGKSLASLVKTLALNADIFAQVWAAREGGEYPSSWRSRLREITKIKARETERVKTVLGGRRGPSVGGMGGLDGTAEEEGEDLSDGERHLDSVQENGLEHSNDCA